jgi:hypothetical protein
MIIGINGFLLGNLKVISVAPSEYGAAAPFSISVLAGVQRSASIPGHINPTEN